ncbi:uncharacterized protein LOC135138221 [Zophobas morio]|uniref:uncharacterized protein LOC135138221 n=1 Tax=Zophobas morio TaxID=2755281 RepID=UPI003083397B
MTESKIFEILLQKQYDFPKLHSEAAFTVANSFADVIYDTLKLKSSLPTAKRFSVLKFLKTLASSSDTHLSVNEHNYQTFIEACTHSENENDQHFLNDVSKELQEQLPGDLCSEVLEFYKRKNEKHQKNIKRMELVKKFDQEALDKAHFSGRITRNISYYETSENVIKKLLHSEELPNIKISEVDSTDLTYRTKQVKFAYSLLYLKQWTPLKTVLDRFVNYKTLTNYEINFLNYLNENVGSGGEHLREFVITNFMFVYEKSLIEMCTKIIQLEGDQVLDYFETLLIDKNYVIIKQLCENECFKHKMKTALFELYSYSFCNTNLLKFIDFLLQ